MLKKKIFFDVENKQFFAVENSCFFVIKSIIPNFVRARVFEAGGGEWGGEGLYEKFFIQKRLLSRLELIYTLFIFAQLVLLHFEHFIARSKL